MKAEDSLQIAVADYLRLQYPDALWCHIGNERQTSPMRGAKLKRMGVRAGVPDIIFFDIPLAIELKIKPNRLTDKQAEFIEQLKKLGWYCYVCYSFDEARRVIDDNYLK